MSETVHYKGKLELVEKDKDEILEDVCKRVLLKHGYRELKNCFDSYGEMLYNKLYNKYVITENNVYKILSKEEVEEYEIFNISDNENGTYDYEVMYYTGGMGLDEAIEESFNRSGINEK